MNAELINGGIGAVMGRATASLLQKAFEHKLQERVSRIATNFRTQSQWIAARLTRTNERAIIAATSNVRSGLRSSQGPHRTSRTPNWRP